MAMRRFSSMLSWNSTVSCSTKLSALRRLAVLIFLMFHAGQFDFARSVSQKRIISLSSVDCLLPLRPVMPSVIIALSPGTQPRG